MKLFCPHNPNFVVGLRLPSILSLYISTGRNFPGLSLKSSKNKKTQYTRKGSTAQKINQYGSAEAAY